MVPMNEDINEYRQQLDKGIIQKAYRELMAYIMDLRTHFARKYPDYAPGNLYYGYMDMTYFPLFPPALKSKKLKIAVVLIHENMRFEAWLSGFNKQIQKQYWELFKARDWNKYHLPSTTTGADSILEYTLVANLDFNDLDILTRQIETSALQFIADVESFLSQH